LTRVYALKGSLINLVISAGPSGAERSWSTMLQTRSAENLFHSVYCNTVGQQKDFSFFGGSKIVSPDGQIELEAKFDEEDFVVGTLDTSLSTLRRKQWLLFRDRRPDVYRLLASELGS
jgi:N-carbamoylputrescine amidase